MFRVGQKVVCVDARGMEHHLQKGTVYTVILVRGYLDTVDSECYLHVDNKPGGGSYYKTRFRPIVYRKTDISIFEALLTPAGQKEPANG